MGNKTDLRGTAIGRFQPFHNGHLVLIKQILEDCSEALIVVGSAQLNYTMANPFTAGERVFMIHKALKDGGFDLSKILIIPLVDEENNARWFSALASMLPPFNILYSGNHLVITLASQHIEVRPPRFERRKEFNGSYIRNRILNGQKWSDLVSKSVFEIINNIDGVNRVKTLAKYELERRKLYSS
jgi:nicotinamide-nucleotide adenylyltransferase